MRQLDERGLSAAIARTETLAGETLGERAGGEVGDGASTGHDEIRIKDARMRYRRLVA
jgi:hypothetical protein